MKMIIYHVDGVREQRSVALKSEVTDVIGLNPVSVSLVTNHVLLKKPDHETLEPNENFVRTSPMYVNGEYVKSITHDHNGLVVLVEDSWGSLPEEPEEPEEP